jgi:hypothetical protein
MEAAAAAAAAAAVNLLMVKEVWMLIKAVNGWS